MPALMVAALTWLVEEVRLYKGGRLFFVLKKGSMGSAGGPF